MRNFTASLSLFLSITPLIPISSVLAQSLEGSDLASSYTCRQAQDQILVEVQNSKDWKQIIEQEGWTCTENTADIPNGQLTFSCEPQSDNILGIVTVTWLNGQDDKKQMAQWMHQFVTDEKMSCSLSTTRTL